MTEDISIESLSDKGVWIDFVNISKYGTSVYVLNRNVIPIYVMDKYYLDKLLPMLEKELSEKAWVCLLEDSDNETPIKF